MESSKSGSYVGAIILIVIGVVALAANLGGGKYVGDSLLLALGLAFLIGYAFTRRYGYLVPGGILTGLGGAVLATSLSGTSDGGAYALIGGGIGFLLIFALDLLVSRINRRWWPVIPGALMIVAGSATATGNDVFVRQAQVWAPVLLIAIGLVILIARPRPVSR